MHAGPAPHLVLASAHPADLFFAPSGPFFEDTPFSEACLDLLNLALLRSGDVAASVSLIFTDCNPMASDGHTSEDPATAHYVMLEIWSAVLTAPRVLREKARRCVHGEHTDVK